MLPVCGPGIHVCVGGIANQAGCRACPCVCPKCTQLHAQGNLQGSVLPASLQGAAKRPLPGITRHFVQTVTWEAQSLGVAAADPAEWSVQGPRSAVGIGRLDASCSGSA